MQTSASWLDWGVGLFAELPKCGNCSSPHRRPAVRVNCMLIDPSWIDLALGGLCYIRPLLHPFDQIVVALCQKSGERDWGGNGDRQGTANSSYNNILQRCQKPGPHQRPQATRLLDVHVAGAAGVVFAGP